MSEVAAFTGYIGLVVLLAATVLLAPRLTVSAWVGALDWARRRAVALLSWRPGTVVAERDVLPVEVSVGERHADDADEVVEWHGLPRLRHALVELWQLAREVVVGHALLLAAAGLGLRVAGSSVDRLPEPAVLTGDLLLVLGAFVVMQRTIRDFPEEWLPRLAALARPSRTDGRYVDSPLRARAQHLLELVLLAPAFVALLAWPTEIGRFVARNQFTGPESTVLVVWACELPWLVALVWWLARPLLPRRRPRGGRHAAPAAVPVLPLRQRPVEAELEQAA